MRDEETIVERLRDDSDDPYFQFTPGVQEWLQRNWALREEAATRIEELERILVREYIQAARTYADAITATLPRKA